MQDHYPIPQSSFSEEERPIRHNIISLILLFVLICMPIGFYFFFYKPASIAKVIQPILTSYGKRQPQEAIVTVKREKIGFLPSWSISTGYDVDLQPFTQIIFFGLGMNKNGTLIKFDSDGNKVLEWDRFTSPLFSSLRDEAKKRGIKMLICIKNFDNATIDSVISNPSATNLFIRQVGDLITNYQLDGVNIDFEYVSDTDFPTRTYLGPFLNRLSSELKNRNKEILVSFDINSTSILDDEAYNISAIGKAVDQIIFMGYDYHRIDSTHSGPVAPLYAPSNEHSIDRSILYLSNEVDIKKIILAVPLYGYEWQTVGTASQSSTFASSGALASYKRVNRLLVENPAIQVNFDTTSKSSWLSYRQDGALKQIWFEDEKSLSAKNDYMKDKNLGGLAFWALGYEGDNAEIWKTFE